MTDLVLVRNDPDEEGQDYVSAPAAESNNLPFCVYAISDERLPEVPFYIGITVNFMARCNQHNSDPSSAANRYVSYLDFWGVNCEMRALARFKNREHARLFESLLIATLPGLKNRDVQTYRRQLVENRLSRHG